MPSNNDPWGDCAVYTSQIVQQPGELVCAKGRLHDTQLNISILRNDCIVSQVVQ